MANECLVTNLKGVVDNDNLPKFGEVKLEVRHTRNDTMILVIGAGEYFSSLEVRAVGGTVTKIDDTHYELGNGNFTIFVNHKYDITGFRVFGANNTSYAQDIYNTIIIDSEELKYSPNLDTATIKVKGNTNNLANCNFKWLNQPDNVINTAEEYAKEVFLSGDIAYITKESLIMLMLQDKADYLTGNISSFTNCPNLIAMKVKGSQFKTSELTGNIASLATVLSLTGDVNFGRTKVTGNAEDMLKGMYVNGRRSGYFSFNGDSYAYLNGQLMGQDWLDCTFSDSGVTITKRTDSSLVATYTAATDSWTYA